MEISSSRLQFLLFILGFVIVPSANSQEYFEWLVGQPEVIASVDLGSQPEVIENVYFSDKTKATTVYDAEMDAAKFTMQEGASSIKIGDQIRLDFPYVDNGNLLVYWESFAPSYWSRDDSVDGVKTYKAFQLARNDDRSLEFRYRFSHVDTPYVARVDVRVYGNKSGVSIGPADSAAPQDGEFNIKPNKWTKFWAFIDFDNNRLTYWVADQDREPVPVLNAIPFDWQKNYGDNFGFNEFWFEYNTSQGRDPGPVVHMYGRHFAVLHNVSDVDSIIGGFQVIRPNSPVLIND